MVVNTNVLSINAHRNMGGNTMALGKASEKLSSGLRINRAADDAAGLAVSEAMRAQIKGLDASSRNVQDGISFAQTAEGALDEVSSMLTRAKELSVQAKNGTYSSTDKNNIKAEMKALGDEISSIYANTTFNGIAITGGATIYAGHKGEVSLSIPGAAAQTLGSTAAPSAVEGLIKAVSTNRANIGALQNRLEHTLKNQNVTSENLSASESRIRDTDMAKEMMNFTKFNVLNQAAQSMMAQSNQIPNQALGLLG